jgi:putative transposase
LLSSAKNANLGLSTHDSPQGEPAGSALLTDADARLGTGIGIGLSARWSRREQKQADHLKPRCATGQDRPDVARRRAQWLNYQPKIEPSRLVFIDETSTKTNMAPLRGWAPRGARLPGKAPFGHWNTMTFLAALRWDRVAAPWLLNKPINGERFQIDVEEVLAPTLSPGDIVIMDNLGAHKAKAVRAAIRGAGAKLLFLPKYSPDLNPIEKLFAKIKHHLRKAQARSVDAVCQTIGQILATVTPQECSNYFAHAGYERT